MLIPRILASCTLVLTTISIGFSAPEPKTAVETEVLFVGNSFTFGHSMLKNAGGVPAVFETIALARGKSVSALMSASSGKSWSFHLNQPDLPALFVETLDWVVLQDYSTRPTRVGDVAAFMTDGHRISDLIFSKAPNAGLILFETWARAKEHEIYQGDSPKFANPTAMFDEIHKSYGELQQALAKGNPAREVRVAPVGTAFARCVEEHPEIPIYEQDLYHADVTGSYLAALVFYATIFEESPVGAETEFSTFSIPEETAAILQQIAAEVALPPAT